MFTDRQTDRQRHRTDNNGICSNKSKMGYKYLIEPFDNTLTANYCAAQNALKAASFNYTYIHTTSDKTNLKQKPIYLKMNYKCINEK